MGLPYQLQLKNVPSNVVPPRSAAPGEENHDPSEKALIAFHVLAKPGGGGILKTQPHLVDLVIEGLPGMVQWGIYLFKQRVDTPLDDAHNTCSFVIRTFNELLSVPKVNAVMIKDTPGIFEMTARYWMKAPPEDLDFTAIFFQNLCFNITWEQLNELSKAAKLEDKPVEIADLALSRAKSHLAKSKVRSLAIATNVLHLLMRKPRHYFTDLLLEKKVVTTYTNTLVKITKLFNAYRGSKETNEWHQLKNCVSVSVVSLRFTLIRNTGFPYIRESLKAGLLQGLCDLAKHFDDLAKFPREYIRIIITESLTRSLVIGCVVKISYEKLKSIGYGAQDEAMRKSYLEKEWDAFKSLTAMREDLLETAPKQKEAQKSCASEMCKAPPKQMKELKLCSGCLVTSYCSAECQRKHWKTGGHKAYCKLKQEEYEERAKEERRMIFEPTNVQYLRNLSTTDINIHLPHLQALARQTYPSVPHNKLVLCIDYTNVDIPTGTCSLKNLSTYEFDEGDEDRGGWLEPEISVLRARQNAELLWIVRDSLSSYTFIEMSFILGEFVIRRNFVSNTNMMERMAEVGFLPKLTKDAEIKKSAACPHLIDP
ncbi:hypothetical protein BT96DRAFT_1012481 [Gymnopus androsaceus JB14]|uniref:MYND-type domain-containing protein n=1 Tax=Gymnopus androsaceus JB14 TaxID=1447944 RepID=A0A6A4ILZ9_9AGAR|nr:hypothetical protein BT96DRAFT_1012481 [Gymnopus androsaceus JB14]